MSNIITNLHDITEREADYVENETGGMYLPRSVTNSWKMIPIPVGGDDTTIRIVHRLNCLGSLFYYAVQCLGKKKFQMTPDASKNLHFQMCLVVEKDGLKECIEIPRDHFKSTVYSECFSSWRALPFTDQDEAYMRHLGYGDRWIKWMKFAHRQDIRILIVSEVIRNAEKIGKRLKSTYEDNATFKYLFPEIIPGSTETWNSLSLTHKRTIEGKVQGEGTYDFIGVGAALQSRHYDMVLQDDLVGRDAYESEITMKKTIEYHQLLVGAFDAEVGDGGRDNDEIIVGNRWAYNDLNSWVRSNETYFNFTTHSALGGCCPLHSTGIPIFPEAFNIEKLARYRKRLGSYLFSCQYLNTPINPAEIKFKQEDIRKFEYIQDWNNTRLVPDRIGEAPTKFVPKVIIRHKVRAGDVEEDIAPRNLKRYIISDPNHSGNAGRCRHAITVTGVAEDPRRIYLLDVWAKATSIEEYVNRLLYMAVERWKVDAIYLETIAAQKYLGYHLEYVIKERARDDFRYQNLKIKELKTPKTANAKKMRIESLGPIFERHEFWANAVGQDEFYEELESYPSGKLVDVLDTLGYGPQVWEFDTNTEEVEKTILQRRAQYARNIRNTLPRFS